MDNGLAGMRAVTGVVNGPLRGLGGEVYKKNHKKREKACVLVKPLYNGWYELGFIPPGA
jgi:hypothetical protein